MKLAILISSLRSGGAERVTASLANHWAGKGWDVAVVTLAPQRNDFYELHPAVERIALELDGGSSNVLVALMQNLRRVFGVRRALRKVQPDIALGMMSAANVLLALASWGLSQIRTVGSERTFPPQDPLGVVWAWLRSHSYSRLDAVVAQTDQGAEWLRANTSAKRVLAIPNPVNWPISRQLPHLDVRNVCRAGRNLLLTVGRLSEEKQFGLLITTFKSLASRHADWDLVILGEGPLHSELEAQVREAGLKDRVILPGIAGNVGEWYESVDLYVLTSRFEGFPNALAEALAYGLPAVSFDCDTGPRDIIRHEVSGLLVPPGDVASLTMALDQMMDDASLRQRLAAQAVEVRERFSMVQIAGIWETLFRGINK